MSFNDISAQRRSSTTSSSSSSTSSSSNKSLEADPIKLFSESLIKFQKNYIHIKNIVTEGKRKPPSVSEKNDLDKLIKELKEFEVKLKNILSEQFRKLENISRTPDVVQKRTTLAKLQKDFEKLRVEMQVAINEASQLKVSHVSNKNNNINNTVFNMSGDRDNNDNNNNNGEDRRNNNKGHPKLVALQGQEVDDAIIEEREKEILKINKELAMVNEMFTDMAAIVDSQKSVIEEIGHVTERSHETAKAGLDQVQQASEHQSTCIIS